MSILTAYQILFVFGLAATIGAAYWAKRNTHAPSMNVVATIPNSVAAATVNLTDAVKDRILALDKLFDDHLLSVEEYVELRKRISSGQAV
jgi:hypothetical protein